METAIICLAYVVLALLGIKAFLICLAIYKEVKRINNRCTLLSPYQYRELADYLVGTCNTIYQGLEACDLDRDLDLDQLQDDLLDFDIELCEECGWWCEVYEMEDTLCEQCRENVCDPE